MKPQKIKDQEELERSRREEATYKCPTATIMAGIQPQAPGSIGEALWGGFGARPGKSLGGEGQKLSRLTVRPSFPILSLPTA